MIISCSSYIFLFFLVSGYPQVLLSFPTRRSSDLAEVQRVHEPAVDAPGVGVAQLLQPRRGAVEGLARDLRRSEEHTSELQSRRDLVCRLLLEKKNYHQIVECEDVVGYAFMLGAEI